MRDEPTQTAITATMMYSRGPRRRFFNFMVFSGYRCGGYARLVFAEGGIGVNPAF
jgi:hypothetical protein